MTPVKSNRTLMRAFDILEIISQSEEGLTLNEVADELGVPVSSAHNLLQTLVSGEYLKRNVQKRYTLGVKMFQIGSRALGGLEVKDQGLPFLKELTQRTGETSHLAIPLKTEVIIVEKVESPHSVRAASPIGTVIEMHAPGTGKSILAFSAESKRSVILSQLSYRAYTKNTKISQATLVKELDRTRARGYGLDDEEVTVGVRCLAAPVFDYTNEVVAAIGITGPASRIAPEKIDDLALSVTEVAHLLSRSLGAALGAASESKHVGG